MKNREVRVRFAPSPTGPLHIGGVRTALFNWLFARKHGGTFILRVEDTDTTRLVPGAEDYINESLKWLGLNPDEGVVQGGAHGPYKQSERAAIYKQYALNLIERGWAYHAFDTPGELESIRARMEAEGKVFAYDSSSRGGLVNSLTLSPHEVQSRLNSGEPHVVRFKMPENMEVKATDMVRGDVVFNTSTLDDKVLFKSFDQMPTYHLANIVDDHLMEISHVIRGEEWLPSLPLHVMLYKAFGWEETMPRFAHLPLILKPSGKGKLSKRDGDSGGFPVFPLRYRSPEGEEASGYREAGYFPEAVINMLAFLGWNPGTEQEIFSLDELARDFSIERVNKAGARFDPDKAKWFNHQYLVKKSNIELAGLLMPLLNMKGIQAQQDKIATIVGLVKERVNFVEELWSQSYFFFEAPVSYDDKVVSKRWKGSIPSFIGEVANVLRDVTEWEAALLKNHVSKMIETHGQDTGAVMNSLRLALVGGSFGPDLFTIIELLGRDETVKRLCLAVEKIQVVQ